MSTDCVKHEKRNRNMNKPRKIMCRKTSGFTWRFASRIEVDDTSFAVSVNCTLVCLSVSASVCLLSVRYRRARQRLVRRDTVNWTAHETPLRSLWWLRWPLRTDRIEWLRRPARVTNAATTHKLSQNRTENKTFNHDPKHNVSNDGTKNNTATKNTRHHIERQWKYKKKN